MEKVTLTVVVMTLNEAGRMRAFLNQLAWAEEILVVDAGSDDGTVEICRQWSRVRVLSRDFDDFAAQRNAGIEAARGEWVLMVDADEEVSPELAGEIQASLDTELDGYWIPRVHVIFGKRMRFGDCRGDRVGRLFRRGRGRYVGAIHEKLEVNGSTGCLQHSLVHHSYESVSQWMKKMNRYTGDEARMAIATGRRFAWGRALLAPSGRFIQAYVLRQGWRDGWAGFVYATLSSYYCLLKHLKHRELLKEPAGAATPVSGE